VGKDRARLTICLKNLYNLCGIGGCPPPYQRSEQSIERLIPQVMPGELEIGQRRFAQGRPGARQGERMKRECPGMGLLQPGGVVADHVRQQLGQRRGETATGREIVLGEIACEDQRINIGRANEELELVLPVRGERFRARSGDAAVLRS